MDCSNCKHKGECPNYNKKEVIKMTESEAKLSEKEQKVYDSLKKTGKPIALLHLREIFGENVVGTIGKLKQLGLVNIITNYKAGKKYRKQVELKPIEGGE